MVFATTENIMAVHSHKYFGSFGLNTYIHGMSNIFLAYLYLYVLRYGNGKRAFSIIGQIP